MNITLPPGSGTGIDWNGLRDTIKAAIPADTYLERSPKAGHGMYNCPFCGSGTGEHGTGAMQTNEDGTAYCHVCGKSYDVIDVYQKTQGIKYHKALQELAERHAIPIPLVTLKNASSCHSDAKSELTPTADKAEPQTAAQTQPAPTPSFSAEKEPDFTDYYAESQERLADPAAVAYLAGRGISLETARAAGIGYDPQADPANAPGGAGPLLHPCPRIIIPTAQDHYVARSIDPATEKRFQKLNPAGGKAGIFKAAALYAEGSGPVFVCEGPFDALACMEVGAQAVALNSVSNAGKLIDLLRPRPEAVTLALALDNDEAGRKAQEALQEQLDALKVDYIAAPICGSHKDPAEALQADRAAFTEAVQAVQTAAGPQRDNTSDYINLAMGDDMEKARDVTPTGFTFLDTMIGGGIYPGLYVVAAISSLGKTTFCLQVCDQIAAQGRDVLFFSLEQSRLELVSKSLARFAALEADQDGLTRSTPTGLQIRQGRAGAIGQRAAAAYQAAVGRRVSIIEGNFACTTDYMARYIRRYIDRNRVKPVVFIDYLQILQPEADALKKSMREVVDTTVTTLKRLSRDLELPIFVVSSVNRSNYMAPVSFEALKESGGIEYTADVIFGLQLACLKEQIFQSDKDVIKKREAIERAKNATPRQVLLHCLKNRYGRSSFDCGFSYYPANELFKENDALAAFSDPIPEPTRKKRF